VPDNKEARLKLLELLYAYSTAPAAEKAEALAELDAAVDAARAGTMFSRQDIKDHLRRNYFPDYYRLRRMQERGSAQ
jgi:hypothetical protein